VVVRPADGDRRDRRARRRLVGARGSQSPGSGERLVSNPGRGARACGVRIDQRAWGSGFLAVYIAGLLAASRGIRRSNELRRFQQGLSWLAQIAMFVTLGLLATPSEFPALLVPGVVLGLFLALVARPLAVYVCLLPFKISWQESTFVAFIGLRGAVSILLAILPLIAGLPEARTLFNVAFIAVMVSLVVQGWGLGPLARALGLVVPERLGAIDRIQLDLPDAAAHELVVYRIGNDSPLLTQKNLPRWVRPALVVREGKSIRSMRVERLRAGDTIYVFVRPHRIALLDRLIASPRAPDATDREFFGDFEIDLDTSIPRSPISPTSMALRSTNKSARSACVIFWKQNSAPQSKSAIGSDWAASN